MLLNDIKDNYGARKKFKRLGRGIGSGKGKTCGRGGKGQTARSGVALKGFEGGQMPLHRRLPKRGFHSMHKKQFAEVNLCFIQRALDSGKLKNDKLITVEALIGSGLVSKYFSKVKLLGSVGLPSKINVECTAVSCAAKSTIEAVGGTVTLVA